MAFARRQKLTKLSDCQFLFIHLNNLCPSLSTLSLLNSTGIASLTEAFTFLVSAATVFSTFSSLGNPNPLPVPPLLARNLHHRSSSPSLLLSVPRVSPIPFRRHYLTGKLHFLNHRFHRAESLSFPPQISIS